MAIVDMVPDKATRAKSYVAKQTTAEHKSFRLPTSRITELRLLFIDLETMMGHRGQAYEAGDVHAVTGGGLDSDVAGISLSTSELWCCLDRKTKRLIAKSYQTLTLIPRWDWMVLWRAYGPREPNAIATADFTAELAPIVRYTPFVEEHRRALRDAMIQEQIERSDRAALLAHVTVESEWEEQLAQCERDELRSAHIEQIRAWRRHGDPGYADIDVNSLNLERMEIARRRQKVVAMGASRRTYAPRITPAARHSVHDAIRRGADSGMTRSMALDALLNAKETGDAAARQAVRDERRAAVAKLGRQADRMLADASIAFQKMWWTL